MITGQQLSMQIPINQLPIRKCACGSALFINQVMIREVSAIVSPNGQETFLFHDGGLICSVCGAPADLTIKPPEEKKLVSLDGGKA